MRVLPVIHDWDHLDRHLHLWHGIGIDHLDNLDSAGLRRLHRDLHAEGPSFMRRTQRPHAHAE